jgi:hypothetical protein
MMIQPEFCHDPVLCSGCDAETTSAVWFLPRDAEMHVILCHTCTAALMFTSMHHPKTEKIIPNKRSVSP